MAETISLTVNVPFEMTVKYCDLVRSKHPDKYPSQVKFKGDNGDTLYLDNPAALKCLHNAGLISEIPEFEDQTQIPEKGGKQLKLAAKKLTFLRTQAPKEKAITLSINGYKADSAPAAAPPAESSQTAAAAANGNGNGREKRTAIYLAATQFVLDKVVPLFEEKEIPVTAENVAAMVNTIYIAETRN